MQNDASADDVAAMPASEDDQNNDAKAPVEAPVEAPEEGGDEAAM